jgi:hypothetical protein
MSAKRKTKLPIQRASLLKLMALGLLTTGLASANALIMPTGVDWNRGGSVWIKEDGVDSQAGFAGVILITLTEDGQQYFRDTFCADLFTPIYLYTNYDTNVLRPDQVPGRNMDRVSWLIDNAALPTHGSGYTSELASQNWVTTVAQGIGLQLAIWDLTSDLGDGFSAGRVQAVTNPGNPTDPTVLYWAQNYLAWSAGKSSNLAFVYDNVNMGNGVPAQMLVGPMFQDGGPAPVPEPSTMGLGAAAMIVIVVSVRKNRQKHAA